MEVINTMNNAGNSIGPAAAIYEECTLLAKGFSKIVFEFSSRESNRVAHTLAANAVGTMFTVWHEDPPDFIRGFLSDDVSLFEH